MTIAILKKLSALSLVIAMLSMQFLAPFSAKIGNAEETESVDEVAVETEAGEESEVTVDSSEPEIENAETTTADDPAEPEETEPALSAESNQLTGTDDENEIDESEIKFVGTPDAPPMLTAYRGTTTPTTTTDQDTSTDSGTSTDMTTSTDDMTETASSTIDLLDSTETFTPATTTSVTASTTSSTATSTSTSTSTQAVSGTATSTEKLGTSSSTPTIISGEAVAMANILNILNTNLINSEGVVLLSNYFQDQNGDIDLRNSSTLTLGGCTLSETCQNVDGVEVRLLNDAYINNAILITATSGDNRIEGGGDAEIRTGDAYAGLNLVNLANANFVNSNYLLVSMNAFKNVAGNIIFPAISKFFQPSGSGAGSTDINNSANVNNDVDLITETGNNTTDSASSTIASGEARTNANVFNNINTSLSGGDTLHILLRVHGDWVGDVFGASFDVDKFKEDSILYITNSQATLRSDANINATNTADINNDVTLAAITGNNEITGAETALITTGNAYAGANLLNIANANVIGKNWILAIINIFGDFNGNVSFGTPDLWVGEQISTPSNIENGTEVEYKFTVINRGDLAATNVRLVDNYDASHLDILNSSFEYEEVEAGTLVWNIGELGEGEATEIVYVARVKNAPPGTNITNVVEVSSREPDNNLEDNTDTATISTSIPKKSGGSSRSTYEERLENLAPPGAALGYVELVRNTQAMSVTGIGATSTQKLTIQNTADLPVRSLVLKDLLVDPDGKVVGTEIWEIGDLLANEEVVIEYDIVFGRLAKPGYYTLSTVLTGRSDMVSNYEANGYINFIVPVAIEEEETVAEVVAVVEPEPLVVENESTTTVTAQIEDVQIPPLNLVASPLKTRSLLEEYWLLLTAISGTIFSLGLRALRWVA